MMSDIQNNNLWIDPLTDNGINRYSTVVELEHNVSLLGR